MITAGSITRMILKTASGWRRQHAFQRGSPGKRGRKSASGKHTRSVLVTAYNRGDSFFSFKNPIEYKQYFPKANITKNILSNFQNCHTAPGKQDCSQSNIQPFTKESCQAELRRKGLLNVVGAWCKPVQSAQRSCRVCYRTFLFLIHIQISPDWLRNEMKWNFFFKHIRLCAAASPTPRKSRSAARHSYGMYLPLWFTHGVLSSCPLWSVGPTLIIVQTSELMNSPRRTWRSVRWCASPQRSKNVLRWVFRDGWKQLINCQKKLDLC